MANEIGETLIGAEALAGRVRGRGAMLSQAYAGGPLREPDGVGFEIEDRFGIGYGPDCGGLCRNLPYLAALRRT